MPISPARPGNRGSEALPRLRWIGSPPNGKSWWWPISIKRKILDWINLEALRLQAREELTNAQGYDAILANSLFSRESIARAYGLSAEVCYLGVDSSLFRPLGKKREVSNSRIACSNGGAGTAGMPALARA